jgi:tetratricopeptide (TPR) repeat protein
VKAARQEYDLVAKQARAQEALTKHVCDVFLRRAKMQQDKFAEWQSAIEDLGTYLTCNPGSAEGYFLRGQLKDKIGEVDAAISDFEQAIKRNSKYGEAYAASAEMHLRRTKPKLKLIQSLLRKAVRYTPKAALPQYRLCTILKDKNRSAARRHCEAYLKLAPKGGYASEAQGLLRNLKSSR